MNDVQRNLALPLRLTVEPITISAAQQLVKQWHRHLPDVQGGLFATSVAIQGRAVGVAIASNPPRLWQGTGRFVISRVATNEHRNACSKLYGAICRAAEALGYYEAWTYTLPEEPGESLRAAGFVDMGLTRGGEHSRPSRKRKPAKRPDRKRRWLRALAPNGADERWRETTQLIDAHNAKQADRKAA